MPGGARVSQEPVSKETREISFFNQINLTTDKECSQISTLGITAILKKIQSALGNELLKILTNKHSD